MSNLSTTDKTLDIAPRGDIREGVPSQGALSQGADPEVLESSSEEGDIREVPKPGKRIHSPDEQSAAKRVKGPGPDAFKFSDIFHVRQRAKCIISVNDLTPFGSLEDTTKGWMIRMFMDPGRHGSPTVTLSFSYDGGKEQWRSTWDVDSYVQGEWAMDELTFTRISGRDPLQFSQDDYQAMMACGASKASLMSMKFRSWARSLSTPPTQKQSIHFPKRSRPSMKAIFCPEKSYTLTIWFVAPGDVVDFQHNCLGVYTRALAARRPPLYRFKDDDGAEFPTWMASRRRNFEALDEEEQVFAPEASPDIDTEKEESVLEESMSLRNGTEAVHIRQHPHLGLRASQPTSKHRPGFTNDFLPAPNPPLDIEIRPKGSANPDDQTELTLTAERSSLPSSPEETDNYSSTFVLREDSRPPPRDYLRAVPSWLSVALPVDDESEDDSGDGSEG